MKICPSLFAMVALALGPTATSAFQQPLSCHPRRTSHLFANSKNIRAAMEATELYGITSPEARLAWETVEEFDANDNSAAFTGDAHFTEEQYAHFNEQIWNTLHMVQQRTENLIHNQNLMKDVAAELHAVKLTPPEKKPAPTIPGLWDSKLKARAISQQYGNDSPQARLAWEEVEEIASTGLENAVGDDMTQECLVTAAEACLALEELDHFLQKKYYNEQAYYQEIHNHQGYNSQEGYNQQNNQQQQYNQEGYQQGYNQQDGYNQQYNQQGYQQY